MNSKPFRWCFIGCGKLANKIARRIIRSGRHEIVSVYSRSLDKCGRFAKKYKAAAYGSAEAAMCAEGVDGVYIVTPHNSHAEYSLLALRLNKPVLCEKPFATDADSAKAVLTLAKQKGVYIAEAMWTWFAPVANKVKEWLDAGEFGKVETAHAKWHIPGSYAARVTDPNRAGGALLDIGVYAVTYAYRLFGKPQSIECKGCVKRGIDLCEDIKFTYPTGTVFTSSISIKRLDCLEKLRINGSKAKITLPFFHCANKVKLVRKHGKSEVFKGFGNYLNEFDLAAEEIKSGISESAFVSHKSTVEVMEILDECRKQLNLVYPFERAGE